MGIAIHDLVQEHEKLIHVLDIIKKIQEKDDLVDKALLKFYSELADFIDMFADKCHHGKEEINLYHTLAPLGDEQERNMIIFLIEEHGQSRKINRELRAAAENGDIKGAEAAAADYSKLLVAHIKHENEELFPSIDKRLSKEVEEKIYQRFIEVEKSTLGEAGVAAIDKLIKGWDELAA